MIHQPSTTDDNAAQAAARRLSLFHGGPDAALLAHDDFPSKGFGRSLTDEQRRRRAEVRAALTALLNER